MPSSEPKHVLAGLRRRLNLTQSELAKRCGCSPVSIQSIEVGRLDLSKKLAERISLVTGAPTEWLLENKPGSPMPTLRKKTESRTSQRHFWSAVILGLRVRDSIDDGDQEALELFDSCTLQYWKELVKAFGERKEIGTYREALDYVKARIDAFLNAKTEVVTASITSFIPAPRAASHPGALKAAEKKQRQPRKAQRRNRASA
jgi:transcriptional regulator with XRE-family HTH domain